MTPFPSSSSAVAGADLFDRVSIHLDVSGPGVPPLLVTGLCETLRAAGFVVQSSHSTTSDLGHIEIAVGAGEQATLTLVPTNSSETIAGIVIAGGAGAISWNLGAAEVVSCVVAALGGYAILPLEVAREWACSYVRGHEPLESEELRWLHLMAAGAPVSAIAEHSHLSERETFRRLRRMYGRLGVTGKVGAVAKAAELGLLGASSEHVADGPVTRSRHIPAGNPSLNRGLHASFPNGTGRPTEPSDH